MLFQQVAMVAMAIFRWLLIFIGAVTNKANGGGKATTFVKQRVVMVAMAIFHRLLISIDAITNKANEGWKKRQLL